MNKIISSFILASLVGLVVTGKKIGWGPFSYLYDWDEEVDKIVKKYDCNTRKKEIIFYGASNFRLWEELENDFKEYKVQNHGFGGSTDSLLIKYADKLLYPYEPSIIVFQTGSNDYVHIKGSEEEIFNECIEIKKRMFKEIHEKLPNTKLIVLSGILMPGRDKYTNLVKRVNQFLASYCDQFDYLFYVNSEELTYQNNDFIKEYFIKDGIHLTHEARLLWKGRYIEPILKIIIKNFNLQEILK